ncbi:hypothetical protein SKAU_G00159120 [Synaphobranchus kaupii]|uniref:Uncharacterized protein n=1 Tax=Synaphobranchus kaupii TaxID=118154 RepID=A0A9Q1IZP7_SYNKA|nr:hypothetical protein SKAU_G00159120 [Synaphobranchus kaupii]
MGKEQWTLGPDSGRTSRPTLRRFRTPKSGRVFLFRHAGIGPDVGRVNFASWVPVTIEIISHIKEAETSNLRRSHLSELNQMINSLNIQAEEERGRRRRNIGEEDLGTFWTLFQNEVMDPYLDRVKVHLERRFAEVDPLAASNVLSPRAAQRDEGSCVADLKLLAKFCQSGPVSRSMWFQGFSR